MSAVTECDWVEVTGRRGAVAWEARARCSRQQQTTAAVLQHDPVKCDDDYDMGVLNEGSRRFHNHREGPL